MTSKLQTKLNRSVTMDLSKIKRKERVKHSSCRNYDKLIRNRNRNDNEIIDLNYEDINLNLIIRNREQQQQQLLNTTKSSDRYIFVEEEEEKSGLILKHDYESINEDSYSSSSSPPKIQPRRIYMNYSNKVFFIYYTLEFHLFFIIITWIELIL
jgi:hypothetical protein